MKTVFLATVLALGVTASASAGPLTLRFQDGFVTISAQNVSLRDILAEWARTGQTRIVNADKVAGQLVTIELAKVPEKQALEILLRSVSGYMVAARSSFAGNLSVFDRIAIMPTSSAAPPPAAASASRPMAQPVAAPFNPSGNPNAPMMQVDDLDEPLSPNPPGVPIYPVAEGVNPIGDPNMTPSGDPAFMQSQGGLQPMPIPDGQSPIRPYATPNDPNAAPPGPVNQVPGPTPMTQGVITAPAPGQMPNPTQKPPQ